MAKTKIEIRGFLMSSRDEVFATGRTVEGGFNVYIAPNILDRFEDENDEVDLGDFLMADLVPNERSYHKGWKATALYKT